MKRLFYILMVFAAAVCSVVFFYLTSPAEGLPAHEEAGTTDVTDALTEPGTTQYHNAEPLPFYSTDPTEAAVLDFNGTEKAIYKKTIYVDLNGDGACNALDAVILLRICAGLRQYDNSYILDLDGNGRIDAPDARILLRAAAKLDAYFVFADGASPDGWAKDGEGRLFFVNGLYANGVRTVDGKSYYFFSGRTLSGLFSLANGNYYADDGGVLQTGTFVLDGRVFVCENGKGVSGFYSDENGTRYCENGFVKTGFFTVDGDNYLSDENGILLTGAYNVDGRTFVCENGKGVSGFYNDVDGTRFYENGFAKTGFFTLDGDNYYSSGDGVLTTGVFSVNNRDFACVNGKGVNGVYTGDGGPRFCKNGWCVTGRYACEYAGYSKYSAKKAVLTVAAVSDTHVNLDSSRQNRTARCWTDISDNIDPDLLIIDGDIVDEANDDNWKAFRRVFYNYLNVDRVIMTLGNHDTWESYDTDHDLASAKSRWLRYTNRMTGLNNTDVCYTYKLKGFHFIVLGSEDLNTAAYISEEQISWADRMISKAEAEDPGKPVFVLLHQPLTYTHRTGALVEDDDDRSFMFAAQSRQLQDMLDSHRNIIYVCGHTHQALSDGSRGYATVEKVGDHITSVNLPSMLYNGQGAVFNIYDDRVEIFTRDLISGDWVPSVSATVSF